MMIDQTIFGFLSIVVTLIGYSFYITSIAQGKTHPHSFTWIIWGLGCGVVVAAQLAKHEGAGTWANGLTFIICCLIVMLSIKNGEKTITRSDKISLVLGLISIPLWLVTKDPLYAVVLIVIADCFGFYPTFRKSYNKPFEENSWMYIFDVVKQMLSMLAMAHGTFTAILYPLFCIISNAAFVSLLFIRRQQMSGRIA